MLRLVLRSCFFSESILTFHNNYRIPSCHAFIVCIFLLTKQFFLFILSCFLLGSNLHPVVQHVSDEIRLRYNIIFGCWNFRYVLGFWSLHMKEGNEYADLEHVQEFLVKGFVRCVLIVRILVIQNLYLMLLDQERNGYTVTNLL